MKVVRHTRQDRREAVPIDADRSAVDGERLVEEWVRRRVSAAAEPFDRVEAAVSAKASGHHRDRGSDIAQAGSIERRHRTMTPPKQRRLAAIMADDEHRRVPFAHSGQLPGSGTERVDPNEVGADAAIGGATTAGLLRPGGCIHDDDAFDVSRKEERPSEAGSDGVFRQPVPMWRETGSLQPGRQRRANGLTRPFPLRVSLNASLGARLACGRHQRSVHRKCRRSSVGTVERKGDR